MAAAGPYAFVALPADEDAWSRDAAAAMADTGRFRRAEAFGNLALFARTGRPGVRSGPGAAAGGQASP